MECRYFTKFKWPYFRTAWGYSHRFRHVDSPTCIVHADVTLTRSKVMVMGLQKLHFSRSVSSTILAWCSNLMVFRDSMGPSLQFAVARFSNFLLRKLSCEFKLCGMTILHKFQMAIFRYCLKIRSHNRARSPRCLRLEACDCDAGRLQHAVHAGGNDRQPLPGLFLSFVTYHLILSLFT